MPLNKNLYIIIPRLYSTIACELTNYLHETYVDGIMHDEWFVCRINLRIEVSRAKNQYVNE